MPTKTCSKCKVDKELEAFSKNSKAKDCLNSVCRACHKLHNSDPDRKRQERIQKSQYYLVNKESINTRNNEYKASNREEMRIAGSVHHQRNKDKRNRQAREYYKAHRDEILQYSKQYQKQHPQQYVTYHKNYVDHRSKTDPVFRLIQQARMRIYNTFRNHNICKPGPTTSITGLNHKDFYNYLLNTFLNNYGRPYNPGEDKVHIDHIIPICTARSEEDVVRLNHHSNLQLLLAADNLKKSNKMPT